MPDGPQDRIPDCKRLAVRWLLALLSMNQEIPKEEDLDSTSGIQVPQGSELKPAWSSGFSLHRSVKNPTRSEVSSERLKKSAHGVQALACQKCLKVQPEGSLKAELQ